MIALGFGAAALARAFGDLLPAPGESAGKKLAALGDRGLGRGVDGGGVGAVAGDERQCVGVPAPYRQRQGVEDVAGRLQLGFGGLALPLGGAAPSGIHEPDDGLVVDAAAADVERLAARCRHAQREFGSFRAQPLDRAPEGRGVLGGKPGEKVFEARLGDGREKRHPARGEMLPSVRTGPPDGDRKGLHRRLGRCGAGLGDEPCGALACGAPTEGEQHRRPGEGHRQEREGEESGQNVDQ